MTARSKYLKERARKLRSEFDACGQSSDASRLVPVARLQGQGDCVTKPKEEFSITGLLLNAFPHPFMSERTTGEIHGDTRGRFSDGEVITITKIVKDFGNGLYKTETGNIYHIIWKK